MCDMVASPDRKGFSRIVAADATASLGVAGTLPAILRPSHLCD